MTVPVASKPEAVPKTVTTRAQTAAVTTQVAPVTTAVPTTYTAHPSWGSRQTCGHHSEEAMTLRVEMTCRPYNQGGDRWESAGRQWLKLPWQG